MKLFETFPILNIDDRFILRQFNRSDDEEYYKLYTAPEIMQFLPDALIPATIEDSALEVENIIQSFNAKQTLYWAIAEKSTGKLIGGCGFHDWSRYNSRIEIAYEIHPNYWRQGIMQKALKEIIKYAFFYMGIVRIQATTLEENEASNNLLLKIGFTKEGVLRKYKFFKKNMVDVLMFSFTIDDFKDNFQ
jgi:ribosomal-protein-alanine N-acetyltransferase